MRLASCLALLLAPLATSAQDKNPSTATTLSLVLPGGGQFYSGEPVKGAVIAAGVMGGLAYASTAIPKLAEDGADRGYYTKHGTTLGIGLGVAGAFWLYGVVDAPNAARRANRRAQVAVMPRLDGGATVALRVAL